VLPGLIAVDPGRDLLVVASQHEAGLLGCQGDGHQALCLQRLGSLVDKDVAEHALQADPAHNNNNTHLVYKPVWFTATNNKNYFFVLT